MQNKPNFQKSQMFITAVSIMNYNKKPAVDTWSKQTQTNPIQSQFRPKLSQNKPNQTQIMVSLSNPFYHERRVTSDERLFHLFTYFLINFINRYGFNVMLWVGAVGLETSAIGFGRRNTMGSSIRGHPGGIGPAEYQNQRRT